MIGRPSRRLRLDPVKPELSKIERLDEGVDHTNRIILVDPIIQAFGQQCRLTAIRASDKALHPSPANHLCREKRITTRQSEKAPRFYTARVRPGRSRRRTGTSDFPLRRPVEVTPNSGPSLRSVDTT